MSAGTRLESTPEPTRYWTGENGLRLAGDLWGSDDGPLVVLQHGGGQTRHAWKGTGEALADAGYQVVAFDARGHGDSDWDPAGRYTQNAMVADLVALTTAMGDPHPVLVGASMGGGTSLVAAGEGHVAAAAVVLVDIAPRIDPDGAAKIAAFMDQAPDGFENLLDVAEAIAAYQPHRSRPRRLDGLAKNVRLGPDGRYHWHWDPKIRDGHLDLDARQQRLEACAGNLHAPSLLVRGGLSDILTEDAAREFLDLCPRAEYVNVPNAAHMVAGDHNDIFGTAVIEFLSRTVPAHQAAQPPPPPPSRPVTDSSDLTDIP